MILGIDHLALSSGDLVHDAKILSDEGYQIRFLEENIPNNFEKAPFLKFFNERHSIAYGAAHRGISLELTQHSEVRQTELSSYQVIFNRAPADIINGSGDPGLGEVWKEALGFSKVQMAIWRPFKAPIWYSSGSEDHGPLSIRGLILPVAALEMAERFWLQGLGCRLVNRGTTRSNKAWSRVAFSAPIQTWSLDLVLVESTSRPSLPYMDDPGFPCLALLTNRLTRDKEGILEMGAKESGGEFFFRVGGKLLKIAIIRGPDHELIELIEHLKSSPKEGG